MPRMSKDAVVTDGDLCHYLTQLGELYGVRVRVALVPLSRPSGKSTHAVTATAYTPAGKRLHAVEATQCYYPGGTSRTITGASLYVATQLESALDEWKAREEREREQWEGGVLTPLEQYIAGSY